MTSRSGKLASALVLAGALGSVDDAHAAEPLALTWRAPPECPQQAAVRARIDALVPAAATSKERLEADGRIDRVRGRFRLKLVMRVGKLSGERRIESDSCQDLAGAAAVALGLMLQSAEPSAETEATSSSDAPAAASTAQPAETAPKPAPISPSPSEGAEAEEEEEDGEADPGARERGGVRDRGWAVLLHGPLLAFDVGPLPDPSFGGAFGGGLALRDWRFSLDFQLGPSQPVSVSGEPRLRAELSRVALEGWICRAWRADPFELSPCLTVGLERVTAEGTGAGIEARSTQTTFVSAGVGAFGHLFISDFFALMVGLGGKVEGARPHVVVESVGEIEQLKPAAFWVKAGPEWIF